MKGKKQSGRTEALCCC